MISANEARKLLNQNETQEIDEVKADLEESIKTACKFSKSTFEYHKNRRLLEIARKLLIDAGYRVEIITALDQRDQDYLKAEW